MKINPIQASDLPFIRQALNQSWGSPRVVSRGVLYDATTLPGFIAIHQNEPEGLITYSIVGAECQIVTLNSRQEGMGIGTALIEAVKTVAERAGCRRLWLITTNDNLAALRFYQKRGFMIAAVHINALENSRKLKPEIPLLGKDGIPLRDEIELEYLLRT